MLSPLYGQLSPLRVPANVRQVADADTLAYIASVQTADGQDLEDSVKFAYEDFIVGCKADGIWTALQASCILAGARTLSGALIPLVGTAPTNNNFVSGDYNRKTGLLGNGSTKKLNSINNNTLAQNNNHIYIRVTDEDRRAASAGLMGTLHAQTGSTSMRRSGGAPLAFSCMSSSGSSISGTNLFTEPVVESAEIAAQHFLEWKTARCFRELARPRRLRALK